MKEYKEKEWFKENTNIDEVSQKLVDKYPFLESFLLVDWDDEDINEKFLVVVFLKEEITKEFFVERKPATTFKAFRIVEKELIQEYFPESKETSISKLLEEDFNQMFDYKSRIDVSIEYKAPL